MTIEFPTLVAIADAHATVHTTGCGCSGITVSAGAHIADMWRYARTITTREQLDSLPSQSVVQSDPAATGDDNPWTWERFDEGWFTTAFSPDGTPDLPARLLWHPDWSES